MLRAVRELRSWGAPAAGRASPSRGCRRDRRPGSRRGVRPRGAWRSRPASRRTAARCRRGPSRAPGRSRRSAPRLGVGDGAGARKRPGARYFGRRVSTSGSPASMCAMTSSSPTVRTPGAICDRRDRAPGRVDDEAAGRRRDRPRHHERVVGGAACGGCGPGAVGAVIGPRPQSASMLDIARMPASIPCQARPAWNGSPAAKRIGTENAEHLLAQPPDRRRADLVVAVGVGPHAHRRGRVAGELDGHLRERRLVEHLHDAHAHRVERLANGAPRPTSAAMCSATASACRKARNACLIGKSPASPGRVDVVEARDQARARGRSAGSPRSSDGQAGVADRRDVGREGDQVVEAARRAVGVADLAGQTSVTTSSVWPSIPRSANSCVTTSCSRGPKAWM